MREEKHGSAIRDIVRGEVGTHIMPQMLPIMLCSDAHKTHQLCFVFQPIMLF